jgi:hypothetical protein
MRPPTTTPPIVPAPIDCGPELAAAWVRVVEVDGAEEEREEDEDEDVLIEEDVPVPLEALVPLRKAWYALHPV